MHQGVVIVAERAGKYLVDSLVGSKVRNRIKSAKKDQKSEKVSKVRKRVKSANQDQKCENGSKVRKRREIEMLLRSTGESGLGHLNYFLVKISLGLVLCWFVVCGWGLLPR